MTPMAVLDSKFRVRGLEGLGIIEQVLAVEFLI
jgi:hypothetical protein